MKKTLLYFILITFNLNFIYSQTYSGGAGTLANPFQVDNKTDLEYLSEHSAEWNKHFIQTAHIIFSSSDFASGGAFWNGGSGFIPIGNSTTNFTGSYNGDQFYIDGLYINRTTHRSAFIGFNASGSTISNLGVINANITGNQNNGVIAGTNSGLIRKCFSSGVQNGNSLTGGLVGSNIGGTIDSSFSTCTINGSHVLGGLVGSFGSGTIDKCYATGNVNGIDLHVGGLVGNTGGAGCVISNSYARGDVYGDSFMGGFIGGNNPGGSIINCYSTGLVTYTHIITTWEDVFIGNSITNSPNYSFFDNQTAGSNISTSGTGKTTLEMNTQATFTTVGWDFTGEVANGTDDIWQMGTATLNDNYPILFWQTLCPTIPTPPTWTGATSTDWHTASNWSSNAVPASSDAITIPDVSLASGNFPITSSNITVENLNIETGASLNIGASFGLIIAQNGTVTNLGSVVLNASASGAAWLDDFTNTTASFIGAITANQYVTTGSGLGQRMFGSPVSNGIVQGLNNTYASASTGQLIMSNCLSAQVDIGSPYNNLFEWHENAVLPNSCEYEAWYAINDAGALQNGRAYSGWVQDGTNISFSGNPNTGSVSYGGSLGNSNNGLVNKDGWHLLSNPYPSAINPNALTSANWQSLQTYQGTSGAYGGTFQPIIPGSDISVMQGFVAFTTVNNNIANFTNAMRSQGSVPLKSNIINSKLDIIVSGNGFSDVTYVYFNDVASQSFDNQWDCVKRESNAGQPTLYTLIGSQKSSLNTNNTADFGDYSIPLGLMPNADDQFTFTVDGLETLSESSLVYLEDKATGVWTNLRDNNLYTFNMTEIENQDRFELHFSKPIQISSDSETCTGNDGSLSIDFGDQSINGNVLAWDYEISFENQIVQDDLETDLVELIDLAPGVYDAIFTNGSLQVDAIISIANKMQVDANFETVNAAFVTDEIIEFNNLSQQATNYIWSINNEEFTSTDIMYSFENVGIYEVSLISKNDDCEDLATETIEISAKTTSIKGLETLNNILAYAKDKSIIIDLSKVDVDGKTTVQVYDLLGQLIHSSFSEKTLMNIEMKHETKGYYLVNINNNNKTKTLKIFIK